MNTLSGISGKHGHLERRYELNVRVQGWFLLLIVIHTRESRSTPPAAVSRANTSAADKSSARVRHSFGNTKSSNPTMSA